MSYKTLSELTLEDLKIKYTFVKQRIKELEEELKKIEEKILEKEGGTP